MLQRLRTPPPTACGTVTVPGDAGPEDGPVSAHDPRALLQIWLSPSFPIGAYAYSHGLEKAVERGSIQDRASLQDWLHDLCTLGSLRNDLILLALAHAAPDHRALRDLSDLSAALQPSSERLLEATQQGASFIQQIDAAWPVAGATLQSAFTDTAPAFAVALGATARRHAIPCDAVLLAYAQSFVSNLVSSAIRLSVVGQTDGQRTVAALLPILMTAAQRAATSSIDDLGGAAFLSDIVSMQHETQYTRLFRS